MSQDDTKETLISVARSPEIFYRDTGMMLDVLEQIESINRRFKNIGHNPERRNVEEK